MREMKPCWKAAPSGRMRFAAIQRACLRASSRRARVPALAEHGQVVQLVDDDPRLVREALGAERLVDLRRDQPGDVAERARRQAVRGPAGEAPELRARLRGEAEARGGGAGEVGPELRGAPEDEADVRVVERRDRAQVADLLHRPAGMEPGAARRGDLPQQAGEERGGPVAELAVVQRAVEPLAEVGLRARAREVEHPRALGEAVDGVRDGGRVAVGEARGAAQPDGRRGRLRHDARAERHRRDALVVAHDQARGARQPVAADVDAADEQVVAVLVDLDRQLPRPVLQPDLALLRGQRQGRRRARCSGATESVRTGAAAAAGARTSASRAGTNSERRAHKRRSM